MTGREGKDIQGDLLAPVGAETWLMNRLMEQGIDVYMDGNFACLRDRIGNVLRAYRYGPVVVGRHNGKPETYEQLFERMYGLKLKDVPKPPVQPTQREAVS